MTLLLCEVGPGLRSSEATVTIRDYLGRRDFLRVERDFLSEVGGKFYLPVSLIHKDAAKEIALVELSGANRIWVKISFLAV